MEKVKIIYIAGAGHSGSTLLNLLIGSGSNTISVGELKRLKIVSQEKKEKGKRRANASFICDCGVKLKECKLWGKVLKEIDEDKLIPYSTTMKEKKELLMRILFNIKKEIPKYKENEKLYAAIIKNAKKIKNKDVEIVIDSSKDLKHLAYLNELENVDLKVIHLIRDGRGVINSYKKLGKNCIKSYWYWLETNFFIKRFLKKYMEKRYMILSYEKFVENPEKYLDRINKSFGTEVDIENYIKETNAGQHHNFAGNWMRRKEIKKIKYDQSWKRMPKWKQTVLFVICYIPNQIWVYNKNIKRE
jgi:hypothetical protein